MSPHKPAGHLDRGQNKKTNNFSPGIEVTWLVLFLIFASHCTKPITMVDKKPASMSSNAILYVGIFKPPSGESKLLTFKDLQTQFINILSTRVFSPPIAFFGQGIN